MKSVHIQLSNEGRYVRMFEVLPRNPKPMFGRLRLCTNAKTLEKSADGDITKVSLLLDQDIRCCMFGSSSMLGEC